MDVPTLQVLVLVLSLSADLAEGADRQLPEMTVGSGRGWGRENWPEESERRGAQTYATELGYFDGHRCRQNNLSWGGIVRVTPTIWAGINAAGSGPCRPALLRQMVPVAPLLRVPVR